MWTPLCPPSALRCKYKPFHCSLAVVFLWDFFFLDNIIKWKQTSVIHKSSFLFFAAAWPVDFLRCEIYVASSPAGWHVDNWCFCRADSSPNEWHWEATVCEEVQRFTGGGRKKVTGDWRGRIGGRKCSAKTEREVTPFTMSHLIWLQRGAGSKNDRWNGFMGLTWGLQPGKCGIPPSVCGIKGWHEFLVGNSSRQIAIP